MPVTVAQTAGFCFGVERAVQKVYDTLRRGEKVCTLGPIIHNPQMVEELSKEGASIADSVAQAPQDSTLVIRSHGVGMKAYDEIAARNLRCVDATCPFVAKIHAIVSEKSRQGNAVLIAGNANHPEVQGICGHCLGPVYVFQTPEELTKIAENNPELQ